MLPQLLKYVDYQLLLFVEVLYYNCNPLSLLDTTNRKTSKPLASDAEQSPAVEFAKRYTSELSVVGRVVLNIWRIVQQEVALTSYTFENVFYHVLHQRTPQYSYQTLTKWYAKGGPLFW